MEFDALTKSSEAEARVVASHASGTVLKAFNGPTRRFAVDHVMTDADHADLPMSLEDLKTGGFVA
jgi:hypothetical protein